MDGPGHTKIKKCHELPMSALYVRSHAQFHRWHSFRTYSSGYCSPPAMEIRIINYEPE